MGKWIQRQNAGDGSTNIQAEVANFGISYEDAKSIAMDVFDQNFHKLAREAHELAFARAEEFTLNYLAQVHEREPEAIQNISDPGIQSDVLAAQSGYAKSGDGDLGEILVDILVDRTQRTQRNITSLCLSESLAVAQKLTSEHFSILAVLFALKNVKLGGVAHPGDLYERLERILKPLEPGLNAASSSDVQYLTAVGCMTISMGSTDPRDVMRETYPGLFNRGLTPDETPDLQEFIGTTLIARCLHDATKFQVNATDSDVATQIANAAGLDEQQRSKLLGLLRSNLMNNDEIGQEIQAASPLAYAAIEKFNSLQLGHASSTAIGIAIGHANVRRLLPGLFETPIEVWIS
jgi:hypothetical protein